MTLIELMVVAGLMMVIVFVAVPVMRPVAEDRASREAVRGIQNTLESAKVRAMKLGRPCGVALIPYSSQTTSEGRTSVTSSFPSVCLKCEPVTCPPNYSGMTKITNVSGNNGAITVTFADVDSSLRATGNAIRINSTGPWFSFTGNPGDKDIKSVRSPRTATSSIQYFEPFWLKNAQPNVSYPYTIRRAPSLNSANPFAKALGMEPPLALPRGTVIDLYYSGVGLTFNSTTDPSVCSSWGNLSDFNKGYPIIILFMPNGEVELFYKGVSHTITIPAVAPSSANNDDATSKIYLLVGKWQRGLRDGGTYLEPSDGMDNLQDPNSYWLVINPRTGVVTSAPNRPANRNDIITARGFAKIQQKGMGSR